MTHRGRRGPSEGATRQTQNTPNKYDSPFSTDNKKNTSDEINELVVVERGISPDLLPTHLASLTRQHFRPEDAAHITYWPTISGSTVALVLHYAGFGKKATPVYLLLDIGAIRVDTYRVGRPE